MTSLSKNIRAFTIVELVIVMVLLAILMMVSIGGITGAQKHAQVNDAVDSTMGMIQNARSQALANMEIDLGTETCTAEEFYIILSSTEINLYADFTADCTSATEQLLDTATFTENVELGTDITQITYTPPLGEIEITTSGDTSITISTVDGLFGKTITINEVAGIPELGS